ncbi:MAG: efflux RND transporter permease subunit [Crocinitomicaceae bacterium]|nr:efflux RND transporter permease subunit [Crocinitomicaceae bacterium]
MKITDISIKRPSLVIVVFTALTIFGVISYSLLNYELLPKFSPSVISIATVYPGASPSEVENSVTKKLEEAVASMEKVKKIEATSFESLSLIVIQLQDNADVNYSMTDAQRNIDAIMSDLPETIKTPSLKKFSFDDLPIVSIAATTDNLSDVEFFDLIEKRIQPLLARVDGVARVITIGGRKREFQVNIDAKKLEAYNLSILQVQQAILSSNMDFPTGSIKSQEQSMLIRLEGKYKDIEELRNLVVIQSQQSNGQVRLRDIADVQETQQDAEKIARLNRKESVALQVLKQTDANAVAVSKKTQKVIKQIEEEYKQYGVKLQIANDTSVYTLNSADAVVHDLIMAILLVAAIMLLFLHSLRNALIVMIAIPISLISTFIGMFFLGFSLNLMSLLALSLVVGILVDDAIVVIENIYRHMEMGKNRVRASIDGTREIGFTVISITLVIVVVFLPIGLSTGMVANILREFCLTIVIAVLLSLFTSFTIVPWLTSRFGTLTHLTGKNLGGKIIIGFEKLLKRFTKWVSGILEWSLRHKISTLVIVITLLVSSFGLVIGGFIGAEFFAQGDRGELLVQVELPKDASLEQTNQIIMKAEEYLSKKPEVKTLITTVGQSSDGMSGISKTLYKGEIALKLVDKSEREDASNILAAKYKKELSKILVGAKVSTAPISIMGMADKAPLEMAIIGTDINEVYAYADRVLDTLRTIPGVAEAILSSESGTPEIAIDLDRDKMAALGLSMQIVGGTLQTSFNGNIDGKFRRGEYEYDINIRLDAFNRKDIEDVKNVSFINNMGQVIHLSQFADVTLKSGPNKLERRDKTASVKVQSQAVGRPVSDIVKDLEAKLSKMDKPLGIDYLWGGDMERQQDGFGSLGIALLVSVLLVYFIMVMLYDSFVHPLVVMFSIPLAIIGAFLALALTNNLLSIFTILGMIMLIGLVAKNAIILVDFTNHLRSQGKSTHDALLLANHARLRPILMTTIAMVFGMFPIAIASGAGAEWKNGLAWVIIGGLISSLFLTLIVVPVVYQLFDSILIKLGLNKPPLAFDELIAEPYDHKEVSEF